MIRTATIIAALALATPALADPCKAIPDRGPMPPYLKRGATFSGPVSYVGDGDSLCVEVVTNGGGNRRQGVAAQGVEAGAQPRGNQWVEVRVEDFFAPELNAPGGREAKQTLTRLAYGKRAVCTASHRSHDRVVATCRINGVSVGDLMRGAGVVEGGNGR